MSVRAGKSAVGGSDQLLVAKPEAVPADLIETMVSAAQLPGRAQTSHSMLEKNGKKQMRTHLAKVKPLRMISLSLALFAVGIIPFNVSAQNGVTSFVSESGFLQFSYPADWSLTVDGDDVIFINSSDGALERMLAGQPTAGDLGLSVVLMPAELLPVLGGSGETSAGALEFILNSPISTVADPGNTQIGDIGTVMFDSGFDASEFTLHTPELNGRVVAIIPAEGVILYITVIGSADDYAEADDVISSILGTLDYTGTAEDAWDEVLFYPLPV